MWFECKLHLSWKLAQLSISTSVVYCPCVDVGVCVSVCVAHINGHQCSRQAGRRAAVRGATVRAVNSVRSFVAILKFMNFSAPRWLWPWLCGLWSAGAAASAAAAACQTEFPTQRGNSAACLHSIYVAKSGSSYALRWPSSPSPFVHLKRSLTSLFPLAKRHLLAAHGMQLKLLYLCYFIITYFLA